MIAALLLLASFAHSQLIDWPVLRRAVARQPSAPAQAVPSEDEFKALVVEAWAKWPHTDLGVIDADGRFRRFWPAFKSDILGEFAPRVDGMNMVSEGRDHRQLSHIRATPAGVSGFVVHAWFVLPESLRTSEAFKGTQAAEKGVFYAVFPMNADEKLRFGSDVRTTIFNDPKNTTLASYYKLFIDPFLP